MLVICLNDLLLRDSFAVARGKQHTVRASMRMTMHNDKVEKLLGTRSHIMLHQCPLLCFEPEQAQRYEHEQFCYIIIKLQESLDLLITYDGEVESVIGNIAEALGGPLKYCFLLSLTRTRPHGDFPHLATSCNKGHFYEWREREKRTIILDRPVSELIIKISLSRVSKDDESHLMAKGVQRNFYFKIVMPFVGYCCKSLNLV